MILLRFSFSINLLIIEIVNIYSYLITHYLDNKIMGLCESCLECERNSKPKEYKKVAIAVNNMENNAIYNKNNNTKLPQYDNLIHKDDNYYAENIYDI